MSALQAIQTIIQTEPIVDNAVIERFRQRRASLVKTLVDAYLTDGPRYFQDLRKSVAAKDFVGARSAAHGLKSCSYNLGAIRLAKICQETENVAASNKIDDLNAALRAVGPTLFDTEEALKGIRARVA